MLKSIALVILLAGQAYAQSKPTIGSFRDFSGGLNTHQSATTIDDSESPDLMNVSIDEIPGALTQRNGYLSCGSIPGGGTATNLYEYAKNNGSRQLIVTDNSSVWQTGDCVVYSTITSGQSATAMPRFATIRDNLWIVNGTTWPIVWDGTNIVSRLDGVGTNPAAYQAKYIAYWKGRVWLANTPTAPSSVYFTSLTNDAGAELNPATSTEAWSALNQVYINRDDGSGITAMRVYRDNMLIGKPDSWSRIVFESEYDLAIAKNATNIGTKFNESVIEMDDGLLRFAGRDGIYAFDGVTPKRLSTKWTPVYESMLQPQIAEQYKLWDTPDDFINGALSNTSTEYFIGEVSLYSSTNSIYDEFTDTATSATRWVSFGNVVPDYNTLPKLMYLFNSPTSGPGGGIYSATTTTSYGKWSINISTIRDFTMRWFFISNSTSIASINGYAVETKTTGSSSVGPTNIEIRLYKYISGSPTLLSQDLVNVTTKSITSYPAGRGCQINAIRSYTGAFIINSDNCDISISANDNSYIGPSNYNLFLHYAGTTLSDTAIDSVTIGGIFSPSGTFTSEITTATGLSVWQNFNADDTLNGQTITYEIRTATSVYNIGLATFTSITPGSVVSTTTNGFAQWRANLSTTDNSVTPTIDNASIGWLTGGSSKSTIYGINYKSRYWLSAATTTASNYNDLMMVESKNPLYTYTRHNLPVSAMTLWNGNLYGSISNTGKIARLDFGSTDDGTAINSYWTSKDFTGENPIYYKTINRVILDYANSPANTGLVVSLSPDEGATWQDRTTNLSASTLSRNTAKLNYTANTALGFRTKVSNSILGIGFKIYGLHPIGTFTEFTGN